jgi:DNA-binding CsgD family transcriptional regulator
VTNPLAGMVMSRPRALTAQQLQIVVLLAQGNSVREIAAALHYSPETIKNYLGVAITRLGANNRLHAVAICYHTGIFQTGEPK